MNLEEIDRMTVEDCALHTAALLRSHGIDDPPFLGEDILSAMRKILKALFILLPKRSIKIDNAP